MKGIWRTNPGGDSYWPNWDKLRAAGVKRIYIPLCKYDTTIGKFVLNTGELTQAYREGVNSQGFEYATYNCWNWLSAYSSPTNMAQDAVAIMDGIGNVAAHMYNDETHDSDRILTLLKSHRALKKTGPISWALEGMQGGWFKKNLVSWINDDVNCVVVPESFSGNMDSLGVQAVRTNIINAGISNSRAKVFLDGAKKLALGWDGCILSEETLP